MDLKRLLDQYQISPRNTELQNEELVQDREIELLIPGQVVCNEHGSFFTVENKYPLTYLYGGVRLGDLFDIDDASFDCLCGNPGLDVRKMIFLDTETTGLSSGTGTVAFLTGIGYIREDCFILRQYFMRDYHEEAALLHELRSVLEQAQSVVTYNGKSFDIPLLSTRFTANRFRAKINSLEHLDLLHISRLFWKGTYENCRLGTIEKQVLGEIRTDDIPGERIPLEYFRYLDTRDASVMTQVIRHNLLDILTLSALLVHFSKMVERRSDTEKANELYGLSKLYEKREDYDGVMECLERKIYLHPEECDIDSLRRISILYKRNGLYDKAVSLWRRYSDLEGGFTMGIKVYATVELAKYLEHQKKDYESALLVVNELMEYVLSNRFFGKIYLKELEKRKSRLERMAK